MTTSIDHLRQIIAKLQNIVNEADKRGCTEINVSCGTHGMRNFVSCGSECYLNLDKNVDDLLDLYGEPEFE